MPDEIDPFDSLLNLEEDFYEEGYQQGYEHGLRQSRLEARLFGIEKGFEKFVVMGKLQAKAMILAARLSASKTSMETTFEKQDGGEHDQNETPISTVQLPPLSYNPRLEKHIQTFLALVDGSTLSTANMDDAVAEFDDRLKRAQAKEKVIEKLIGETTSGASREAHDSNLGNRNTDDFENFGSK